MTNDEDDAAPIMISSDDDDAAPQSQPAQPARPAQSARPAQHSQNNRPKKRQRQDNNEPVLTIEDKTYMKYVMKPSRHNAFIKAKKKNPQLSAAAYDKKADKRNESAIKSKENKRAREQKQFLEMVDQEFAENQTQRDLATERTEQQDRRDAAGMSVLQALQEATTQMVNALGDTDSVMDRMDRQERLG